MDSQETHIRLPSAVLKWLMAHEEDELLKDVVCCCENLQMSLYKGFKSNRKVKSCKRGRERGSEILLVFMRYRYIPGLAWDSTPCNWSSPLVVHTWTNNALAHIVCRETGHKHLNNPKLEKLFTDRRPFWRLKLHQTFRQWVLRKGWIRRWKFPALKLLKLREKKPLDGSINSSHLVNRAACLPWALFHVYLKLPKLFKLLEESSSLFTEMDEFAQSARSCPGL